MRELDFATSGDAPARPVLAVGRHAGPGDHARAELLDAHAELLDAA